MEVKENKALMALDTTSIKENLLFSENTDGYTEEEVNGVVIKRLVVGKYSNGNDIAITDPKAIDAVRLVRSLNDMDNNASKIRCAMLSELRRSEVHKKAGVKNFGEFMGYAFPQYDGKTLGIWANIGDAFYIPIVSEDGEHIVNFTERYTAFADFEVSKLQVLLSVVNDESLGIDRLIEDVANGTLYGAMSQREIKEYVKKLRTPVNDDSDDKDSKGSKDSKDSKSDKFDAAKADNTELVAYMNDVAATLKLTLAVVETRCNDESPLATDEFTIKAFKGLATAVKCYLNKINRLVILDNEESNEEVNEEAPESADSAPESANE